MKTMPELVRKWNMKTCGQTKYDIYRLIVMFSYENGVSPNYREIAEGLVEIPDGSINGKSIGNIGYYLDKLATEGYIKASEGKRFRIELANSVLVVEDEQVTRKIITSDTFNFKPRMDGQESTL